DGTQPAQDTQVDGAVETQAATSINGTGSGGGLTALPPGPSSVLMHGYTGYGLTGYGDQAFFSNSNPLSTFLSTPAGNPFLAARALRLYGKQTANVVMETEPQAAADMLALLACTDPKSCLVELVRLKDFLSKPSAPGQGKVAAELVMHAPILLTTLLGQEAYENLSKTKGQARVNLLQAMLHHQLAGYNGKCNEKVGCTPSVEPLPQDRRLSFGVAASSMAPTMMRPRPFSPSAAARTAAPPSGRPSLPA
ncbi:hypothetical protein Agub_g15976, partial [Astrephomene gubernaculifera]